MAKGKKFLRKQLEKRLKVDNYGYSETGANSTRGSMAGWLPIRSSPQQDIDENLGRLRGRAASLAMGGSCVATGALNNSRMNVIGAGLNLSPKPIYRILGISADEAEEWAYMTRTAFDMWAGSIFCDKYHRNNFYDLQDIAYNAQMVDGDCFAVIQREPETAFMPFSLRIQLIEGSRVCNPNSDGSTYPVYSNNQVNGNRIISGVEIDDGGAVVAYYIANKYPNDFGARGPTTWTRVAAFGKETGLQNVMQICHDDRPAQYRGTPYMAPVIEAMKQVGRFTDAELMTAIIKSYFSLFFTQSQQHNDAFPLKDGGGNQTASYDDLRNAKFKLGMGTMNAVPPGWDVKELDASKNLSTFDSFTTQVIKQIGTALGQPYEVLMKTFQASYTASRAALLQAWMDFRRRRTWFARDFCQPVYEWWLSEAVDKGYIKAPGYFENPIMRAAWQKADWFGPVMGILDPSREITAAGKRIEWGLSTREKEAAELTGTSYAENVQRIAIENAKLEENGLPLYPDNTLPSEANFPDSDLDDDTEGKDDE